MLYIVLLHYPVYNKNGKIVTTGIANMDIHDISRIAKTYGAAGFYIVNPICEQRNLAEEIIGHWRKGYGAEYNRFRKEAFQLVSAKESLRDVAEEVSLKTGSVPKTIVTGANISVDVQTFAGLKKILRDNYHLPHLIIFGTGSGLADDVLNTADYKLEPIKGNSDYNHLAVRSAVAIVLDRLTSV